MYRRTNLGSLSTGPDTHRNMPAALAFQVAHSSPGQRFGALANCSVHTSNACSNTKVWWCSWLHQATSWSREWRLAPKLIQLLSLLSSAPHGHTHSHTHFRLGSLDVNCNHSVLQKEHLTTEQHCSTMEYATQHTLSQGYIQPQTSAAERKKRRQTTTAASC